MTVDARMTELEEFAKGHINIWDLVAADGRKFLFRWVFDASCVVVVTLTPTQFIALTTDGLCKSAGTDPKKVLTVIEQYFQDH